MYQIMLSAIHIDLTEQRLFEGFIGGSEDSAVCLAIAADQDALSERLVACSDARVTNARRALTSVGALNELARSLYLLECSSNAKVFANRMLEAAIVFETAGLEDPEGLKHEGAEATEVWGVLMSEGILGDYSFDTDSY